MLKGFNVEYIIGGVIIGIFGGLIYRHFKSSSNPAAPVSGASDGIKDVRPSSKRQEK